MKYKSLIVLCLMLFFILTACTNENATDPTDENNNASVDQQVENHHAGSKQSIVGLTKCGEVYENKDFSYNVIGVRTNEYSDGVNYLIVKLEVLNHSGKEQYFSPLDRLALYGGDTEYTLDILADVETSLAGNITPDNKIMGEVAFEITDSNHDNYVLHIGSNFEYSPAIEISSDDFGQTFAEQFEESGVTSEYTIGIPLESAQLSVLLNSATVKASNKEGKELLLLDLTITNNKSESAYFMLGMNLDGVFTSDGIKLEEAVNDWTLGSSVNANGSIQGIASFYIEKGTREFYMTVAPDLNDFTNKENIVFTAQ